MKIIGIITNTIWVHCIFPRIDSKAVLNIKYTFQCTLISRHNGKGNFNGPLSTYNRGNNSLEKCNISVLVWFATGKVGHDIYYNTICVNNPMTCWTTFKF